MSLPRRMTTTFGAIVLLIVPLIVSQNRAEEVSGNNGDKRPNIVFIIADDLGFNDVGYHNEKQAYTPTIDELARSGVRLENHYVQPICAPTRSQFISGRSQIHTGLQHNNLLRDRPKALPLDSPTLPDKLKEAGYATDLVGKWHLGFYHEDYLPTSRGFDTFYGLYAGQGDHYRHTACMGKRCVLDLHNDTSSRRSDDRKQQGFFSTELFTQEASRVIKHRAQEDNPFFLYLAYTAVHIPIQVGFLVFTSDNGAENRFGGSNFPLKGVKRTFFEGGVRGVAFANSPLFNKTGYINNEIIHVTDWFPTLMHLANGTLEGTRDVNGFNQWETLSNGSPSPREEILFNIDPTLVDTISTFYKHDSFDTRMLAAYRRGDYKIITGFPNAPGIHLYNVVEDPNETTNLIMSNNPSYNTTADEMLERLQEFQQTAVPVYNPHNDPQFKLGSSWQPWRKSNERLNYRLI